MENDLKTFKKLIYELKNGGTFKWICSKLNMKK